MPPLGGLACPEKPKGRDTWGSARPHQSNPLQRIDELHSGIDLDLQGIGLSLLREVERWRVSRAAVDQVFADIAREARR